MSNLEVVLSAEVDALKRSTKRLQLIIYLAIAILIAILMYLFAEHQGITQNASSTGLIDRTDYAFKEIRDISQKISTVSDKISKLESDSLFQKVQIDIAEKKEAEIDLFNKTYSSVGTDVGMLLVSFKDAEAYLSGIQAKIAIGNPYLCNFNGMEIIVKYGPKYPEKLKKKYEQKVYDEWQASLRTMTHDLTEHILPGQWNTVSIILPDIKLEDFGYCLVTVHVNTINFVQR